MKSPQQTSLPLPKPGYPLSEDSLPQATDPLPQQVASLRANKQTSHTEQNPCFGGIPATESTVPGKETSEIDLATGELSEPVAQMTPTLDSATKSDAPETANPAILTVVSGGLSSTPTELPAAKCSVPDAAKIWKGFVKDSPRKLSPTQTPFILESGEACVTIPNVVIEKNKKAWDSFIIGQFYDEPPARGAVHAIINGIWSRQKRDISVSKMEGNAFLFRVPCPSARRRILSQCLWQIDGQTMFVAKWSPDIQQEKPALTTVPVWLEFTGVPLQFFNRDALQEIAGLVGHPICLHPSTENLLNIEVAKVYTIIDPTKPLPNFVNASFESGVIQRIAVSCPWLPSICSYCKKVGHAISRCKLAPSTCTLCRSVKHMDVDCPRAKGNTNGKAPIKSLLPIVNSPRMVYKQVRDNNHPASARNPG